MTDPPPEFAAMVRQKIMALSGEERFCMGVRSFTAARDLALASLPKEPPGLERRKLLYKRIYGEDPPEGLR